MVATLKMTQVSVSEMDNNCYLLYANGEGLLIDAADDAPRLLSMAENARVKITKVLTTHRHWDHTRALQAVLDATGATHYAPFLDAPALPVPVDVELREGDTITVGGVDVDVLILRGHTPGGAAVHAVIETADGEKQDALFVGDSLFPGGLGKTNCDSDFFRLFNDVNNRIFNEYGDDTVIYPGHGAATTVGAERPQLDEWRERRW